MEDEFAPEPDVLPPDTEFLAELSDGPLNDPEKEAKRQKRRAYRERKKLKREAGLWTKGKSNPNVYISGLPPDVTVDELYEIFRLAGQIKPDVANGLSHKIKLYGHGDALVSYMYEDSVGLTIQRFHEYAIRPDYVISVQQADFAGEVAEKKPQLSTAELQNLAEINRVSRQKHLDLLKKEKDLRSKWDSSDVTSTSKQLPVIVFGITDYASEDMLDRDYMEQELALYCEKFGLVKKVKSLTNTPYICVKFLKIESALLCLESVSETGISVGPPESFVHLSGFLHDGRDLTWAGTNSNISSSSVANGEILNVYPNPDHNETAKNESMSWEQFLGDSDSDDADLQIRTE